MIRNPEIILLDEATSALDNISEHVVQKAMQELIRGRTTFIVAHRLSTIRDADRIVVMKNGRVAEIGTYRELLERRGEFYQLKQLQA
ncbi:Heterocyst differentiation ATP-binding protein HepA [compost metagenome]